MITSMKINNFKCFKDFDINLGPFNVLIGPNDSGKTSFLQAIFAASAAGISDGPMNWSTCEQKGGFILKNIFWKEKSSNGKFKIRTSVPFEQFDCHLAICFDEKEKLLKRSVIVPGDQETLFEKIKKEKGGNERFICDWTRTAIGEPMYFMLNPSDLRKKSPMAGTQKISSTGVGFPTFLEDFFREDRRLYFAMEEEFYKSFHHYKSFDVQKSGTDNIITFTTKDYIELSVQNISDGTLLYLAYLALAYQPNPPKLFLIEEPENGVHHASLKKIIDVLRVLSEKKGVQIIMTTHSPYLLDLVAPEEVQVFAKDDEGAVHAKKLSDYPEVQRMKKHFMTGEIWTELSEEEIVFGSDKVGTKE